jgi:hypothetical protein
MSKKLIVKALFDVNRVPELSKLSEALNLNIGSDIAAKADIDKNWKTTELSDAVYIMSVKLLQQEMVMLMGLEMFQ